jgi:hypothetical protein
MQKPDDVIFCSQTQCALDPGIVGMAARLPRGAVTHRMSGQPEILDCGANGNKLFDLGDFRM